MCINANDINKQLLAACQAHALLLQWHVWQKQLVGWREIIWQNRDPAVNPSLNSITSNQSYLTVTLERRSRSYEDTDVIRTGETWADQMTRSAWCSESAKERCHFVLLTTEGVTKDNHFFKET